MSLLLLENSSHLLIESGAHLLLEDLQSAATPRMLAGLVGPTELLAATAPTSARGLLQLTQTAPAQRTARTTPDELVGLTHPTER